MSRLQSARQAGRSLDVQTYLWHNDTTGLYLAREALRAADRGVQVRLLVDDMDARDRTPGFAALAAHPNIAVRMFNPFASRRGKAAFASEGLRSFGGQTPMGRPGQPVELASIYVQLAASDASYATGQVYGSSGGAGQP